ncbi:hypothetical protein ACPCJT_20330 [Streptomyces griseoincarnatus]
MTHLIYAPWTAEQVTALNAFQHHGRMHPFTCGAEHASGRSPVLIATNGGWVCPDPQCVYRQDWAHAFMVGRGAAVSAAVAPPTDDTDAELTAEEARTLADDLSLQLYRAQDALAFVGECCDIADREQRPITTADVREWLKGARCGRQLAADAGGHTDRRDKYAEALDAAFTTVEDFDATTAADAVLAVADAEQAHLRAQVANLRTMYDSVAERARDLIDERDALAGNLRRAAGQLADAQARLAVLEGQATTPTDRAALRDRIADKLTAAAHECDGKCGLSERECYDAHPITFSAMAGGTTHVDGSVTAIADAVLAVLPSAADWDALVREADRLRRDGKALHARAEEIDTQLAALRRQVTEPTNRAAVSREAEAELYVLLRKAGEPRDEAQALIDRHRDEVLRRAALRRMADETATTGAEYVAQHACTQFGTWFDRSVCSEPCGAMHTRCTECGVALDACPQQPAAGARQDGAQP